MASQHKQRPTQRPPHGSERLPHARRRSAGGTTVVTLFLLFTTCLIGAGIYMMLHPAALMPARQSHVTAKQTANQTTEVAFTQQAAATPAPFCQRDFTATAQRRDDLAALAAAGGVVHLLKRPQADAPFQCAAFYLDLGLDINATGAKGLTALHYAIKANNPDMLRFVIAHAPNLQKKAGAKQLEPMGYAYYLALNHPKTNRNRIIAILNEALVATGQ